MLLSAVFRNPCLGCEADTIQKHTHFLGSAVALVEKESVFCILYNPFQALVQVHARHGAAWKYCPLVGLNRIEPETLHCACEFHDRQIPRLRSQKL